MSDDGYTRITLRLPDALHAKLTEEASRTSKSMNAEIVGRLEATFGPPVFDGDIHEAVREAIKDVMAEMPIFGPPVENMLAVKPSKTKEK